MNFQHHLCPHLKLLPELQVDVVHLGNGNVVILSLLLVQQFVPMREKMEKGESVFLKLLFLPPIIHASHPLSTHHTEINLYISAAL